MKCLLEDWTGKVCEGVLVEDIEHLPSAKPKKGKWIKTPYADNDSYENYKCPICEKGFAYINRTEAKPNFCMNCGADMRG